MKIKKGDLVQIMMGKDKGKTGKVERVIHEKSQIVVEGLNIYKRHVKGFRGQTQSEIKPFSRPLPVSKVSLIDPKTKKPTRVGYKMENDKRVRFAKKSGGVL
jgi:large subunit ribosomal protein L24